MRRKSGKSRPTPAGAILRCAYPLVRIDHTGFARGTIGTHQGNPEHESNIDPGVTCRDTRKVMEPKKGLSSVAAPSSTSAATAIDTRHEKRLHLAVRVKVFPDIASPESQNCCTYEISTQGARLVAPAGIKSVGQTIWLQRQSRRARYKVVWIGEPGTSLQSQVGVETLEPGNVIWEPEIRQRIMRS